MSKAALCLVAAVAFTGLAGCMKTAEQQKIAADDAKCRSYGAPIGSQGYILCRAQLDQARSDRKAAQIAGGGVVGALAD